ncbi:hypothetical protein E2C01_042718 [Portunus trituberculatus]|uniref:Uncharacterized protein n=1 Tax=Portunus trituberculatus TaxID=210409 RepID=A0A5B7FN47_PORTR|nr:hypothetical protein [Portunus trituberculatus]
MTSYYNGVARKVKVMRRGGSSDSPINSWMACGGDGGGDGEERERARCMYTCTPPRARPPTIHLPTSQPANQPDPSPASHSQRGDTARHYTLSFFLRSQSKRIKLLVQKYE